MNSQLFSPFFVFFLFSISRRKRENILSLFSKKKEKILSVEKSERNSYFLCACFFLNPFNQSKNKSEELTI